MSSSVRRSPLGLLDPRRRRGPRRETWPLADPLQPPVEVVDRGGRSAHCPARGRNGGLLRSGDIRDHWRTPGKPRRNLLRYSRKPDGPSPSLAAIRTGRGSGLRSRGCDRRVASNNGRHQCHAVHGRWAPPQRPASCPAGDRYLRAGIGRATERRLSVPLRQPYRRPVLARLSSRRPSGRVSRRTLGSNGYPSATGRRSRSVKRPRKPQGRTLGHPPSLGRSLPCLPGRTRHPDWKGRRRCHRLLLRPNAACAYPRYRPEPSHVDDPRGPHHASILPPLQAHWSSCDQDRVVWREQPPLASSIAPSAVSDICETLAVGGHC